MNSKTYLYSELKPKAIMLRSRGKTFSEIQNKLGNIPKGTLSGWLKHIELTEIQKDRIKKIITDNGLPGRQLGAWKNHQMRLDRISTITKAANHQYKANIDHPLFLAGLILYLAEGSKKNEQFQFMNSDPYLIKCMAEWINVFGDHTKEQLRFRLYIHELYAHENCEAFWVKKLGVQVSQFGKTIYKPNIRKYKKNPQYKGCLRIEVRGNELYWKTMAWRDCFYSSIG